MDILEVSCHMATCILMQGFEDGLIYDEDLKEICEEGFDALESHVRKSLYNPEYPHLVFQSNDL